MNYLFISIFITLLSVTSGVHAYTGFIGYGYSSCLTCHFNPAGNGPLNDYGRAVSATAISGKFLQWDASEETLSKRSNFLFGAAELPQWIRPNLDYRLLRYTTDFGKGTRETKSIPMQLDANVVFKMGEGDKYIASFSYGKNPIPETASAAQRAEHEDWISREHYVGVRPIPSVGIYAGFMDKTFGLRIPDHIAFSRAATGLRQNDQTYGMMGHYIKDWFEGYLHYFVGNTELEEDLRQKGLSTLMEFAVWSKTRFGFSYLTSTNDYVKNGAMSVHWRQGFGKGSSWVAEYGKSSKDPVLASSAATKLEYDYFFWQSMLRITRGIHFLTTFEYLKSTNNVDETLRFTPGFQIFPMQRFEFRLEFANTRILSNDSVTEDDWNMQGQVHASF